MKTANKKYRYSPSFFDSIIAPPDGINDGDIVTVINDASLPKSKGNSFVTKDGGPVRMVNDNSLEKV